MLLIEDHPDTRFAMTLVLQISGFQVISESDARAAQQRLSGERFHVVLADLTLSNDTPGRERSWRDVGDIVRAARPAPVGLLSGWQVSATQVAQHGLAFALLKPCDLQVLLAEIRRAMYPAAEQHSRRSL